MPTTSANSTSCYLAKGDSSSAVKALQMALNCYGKNLATDGVFGTNTYNALRSVQSSLKITVDGVYGTQSRDHMKFQSSAMDLSCWYWAVQ